MNPPASLRLRTTHFWKASSAYGTCQPPYLGSPVVSSFVSIGACATPSSVIHSSTITLRMSANLQSVGWQDNSRAVRTGNLAMVFSLCDDGPLASFVLGRGRDPILDMAGGDFSTPPVRRTKSSSMSVIGCIPWLVTRER